MSRRLCAALAVLSVLAGLAVVSGPAPLRVAGGIPLAFLLPGLALTAALFRDRISLTGIEKCMLIPALSLATLVLGGLAAWGLGFSLHRPAWLAVSELVTLASFGTVVVWPIPQPEPQRKRGVRAVLPTPGDTTLILPYFRDRVHGFEAEPRWWRKLVPARPHRDLIPLLAAVALLAGSGWFSFQQSRAAHDVHVTALWAAPPSAANLFGERTVSVTATGLPALTRAYELVVTGDDGVTTRKSLFADQDGRWSGRITIRGGERTRVELVAAGTTTAARTLIVAAT